MKPLKTVSRRILVSVALFSLYMVLLSVVLKDIRLPYNSLNTGMIIYPSIKPLLLLTAVLTFGLGFSYLATGSVLEYVSMLSTSMYILWLFLPEAGLAGFILIISLPLAMTLIPVILYMVKKNRITEPFLLKSSVCIKIGMKPIILLGFISGLGVGFSIQGLLGWLTIYNGWLYWLLGTLASALLGSCFLYYNPVLLGLSASFSILSLPVSVLLSLVSPLKILRQGEGPRVGDVIGGLYFWSKLDALEFPFNYSEGIVSWHWAMTADSKLYLSSMIGFPGKPNLNSIVMGRSGSGKSLLTKRLVSSFSAKDYRVLVLDFHGEYADVIDDGRVVDFWNSNYYLDFKSIKGDGEFKAQIITDAFRSIYNLGGRQYTMLYDALTDYFSTENTESLSKLVPRSLLSLSDASGFSDRPSVISLAQYIRQLGYLFEGELPVNVLLEGKDNVIIDLSKIPGIHLRLATAELVLRILYNTMTTASASSRRLLVVEEAHHFNNKSILSKLYTESRKFGLTIISVTQNPKALPEDIVINSTNKLMFGMDEPENLDYITRILTPIDKEQNILLKDTISSLPPGYTLFSNKLLGKEILLIKVF
ncbi:MAG: DUF87 domain-containing protein [Desulfurococcales archaeon]|nr:DUF87 domain-containing protein [Desulfurococcales archaeon]